MTAVGVDRAKEVGNLVNKPDVDLELRKSDHQERQRVLNELERHPAFRRFMHVGNCDDIEWHEFTDFLRCLVDTPPRKLMERIETYRSQAHEAGREDILNFIAACEKRFNDRLGK